MQRYAMVTGIKPEKLQEYKDLHADAWPGVLQQLRDHNVRNFSIHLYEDQYLLFGYLEYTGDDFDADMARIAADPVTRDWWALTDPCQIPPKSAQLGQQWAPLEEVFYTD